ncbi:hypothetical protein FBZ98_108190 [Rhizobium sp. ERR 922]|uniref:hypothetical protein n=1 Tax=unclassified Rhizobium TaxID=2613769 RepID=UPI000DE0A89F|nr:MULTISPECIES: hypothetical protein [unclassified Rhizobium]TWB10906.1 hypothetical protein FBZ99_110126 [Rhizobium sp. ERR1071]TWB48571.1 hypothetical protein FBZ98_108190 [Rhizobium sp. ERR 922]TWB90292.1 hypothetical protein FBZ97_109190 [Rhizobium sp. ERR 942]GES41483.1 hypothetical protein RsS62_07350 [Rhizobium dioscoreae]
MELEKELHIAEIGAALHPKRRMVVLRREDGFYTYAEQYHYVSHYEGKIIAEGWVTLPSDGMHTTSKIAEIEGRAAFSRRYGVAY